MSENTENTKVLTGEVRLGYVHLLEPRPAQDGEGKAKYQAMIVVPKSDTATVAKLKAAQKAAAAAGLAGKWQGKAPKGQVDAFGQVNGTIKDGDDEAVTDLAKNPELEGCYYLNVSSDRKPQVVDRRKNLLTDPDEVYSGMFARVTINAYPYNFNGKRGVTFGLGNVQKLRDGERFGGGATADEDFDELDEEELDDLV